MLEERSSELEERTIETVLSNRKKLTASRTYGAIIDDLTFMSWDSQKERRKKKDRRKGRLKKYPQK